MQHPAFRGGCSAEARLEGVAAVGNGLPERTGTSGGEFGRLSGGEGHRAYVEEPSPAMSMGSAESMGSPPTVASCEAVEADAAFEEEYGDELVFLVNNSMQVDESKGAQTHMPYIF